MPNGNNHDVIHLFPCVVGGVLVWQDINCEAPILNHFHHFVLRFDKFFPIPRYQYAMAYDGSGDEVDHPYESLLLETLDYIESFRLIELVFAELVNTFTEHQWSFTLHLHVPAPDVSTDFNLDDVWDKNNRNYGWVTNLIMGCDMPLSAWAGRDVASPGYFGVSVGQNADWFSELRFICGRYQALSVNLRGAGGDIAHIQMIAEPTFKPKGLEDLFDKESDLWT